MNDLVKRERITQIHIRKKEFQNDYILRHRGQENQSGYFLKIMFPKKSSYFLGKNMKSLLFQTVNFAVDC